MRSEKSKEKNREKMRLKMAHLRSTEEGRKRENERVASIYRKAKESDKIEDRIYIEGKRAYQRVYRRFEYRRLHPAVKSKISNNDTDEGAPTF